MFDIFSTINSTTSSADTKTGSQSDSECSVGAAEMEFILGALNRSQACIHFRPDGTILAANANFLNVMGYSKEEVIGKHHSMFAEPGFEKTQEYKDFWNSLCRGEYQSAEYKRVGKGGKEVWIQATYNPILDKQGSVVKVVKYATDITEQTLQNANKSGQVDAINRSQATIEFELDGTIITANQGMLDVMGYDLEEVKGRHHRMFVEAGFSASQEYKDFWTSLAAGKYQASQYKRIGKGGKEVWIQATYNPIMDPSGKPFKVVKFATDVTAQVLQNSDFSGQLDAIGKSQAVISFNMDGTIIEANDNFLKTVGYSLDEIVGKHHGMFAEPDYAASTEYKKFWEKLGHGEFDTGEYKRIGKGGKEIWIQASYNPIFDPDGKPFKVVKYATDITAQHLAREEAVRVGALVDENLEKILGTVGDASEQANIGSRASGEALMTVQTVASAAEEFQSSTQEIARSMEASREQVTKAMEEANSADHSTNELSQAALAMNNIVEVIQDIAGQINLLALNATIESARAGEAGKGFAVVASEVKSLANEVAKATTQISSEIGSMQGISSDVVERLESIKSAVEGVESTVTSVAGAVEEQVATSHEITSSMQTASVAVEEINTSLSSISGAVNSAEGFAREGIEMYRQANVTL